MDRLGRHFIEKGFDVRAPAPFGSRCGQAMHEVVRANGVWPRCVDCCQDAFDLALGDTCLPIGFLELSPDVFDVLGGYDGHLDFDACDTPLRFLERAISLYPPSNGPVGHDHLRSDHTVTGLRSQAGRRITCAKKVFHYPGSKMLIHWIFLVFSGSGRCLVPQPRNRQSVENITVISAGPLDGRFRRRHDAWSSQSNAPGLLTGRPERI